MPARRICLAASIGLVVLLLVPGINRSALGQAVCNFSGTPAGPCTVQFDSDTITLQPTSPNSFSFTVSGKNAGAGSFSLTAVGQTTAQIAGSGTVDGVTGTLSCTIDFRTQTIVTGQCGILTAVFAGSTQTKAAANASSAAQGTVRSQTLAVTTIVSDRVRAISRDIARSFAPGSPNGPSGSNYRGLSAGSADASWGVWGDASGAFLRNDSAVGYDGNSVVAIAGIDYIPVQSWLVGLTAGYTHADLTLKSVTGTRRSDGAVVGPYVSYIISTNFSADVQFQYTGLSNSLTAPSAGLTGNFGSDRATGAFHINAFADEGPFKFTGFTGYSYTWEGSDKSSLSNIPGSSSITRYGVVNLGGEVAYVVNPIYHVEVYVPLALLFETTTSRDGTSHFGIQPGVGVRWQWADNIAAGISLTTIEVKSHTQDVAATGHLRWTF